MKKSILFAFIFLSLKIGLAQESILNGVTFRIHSSILEEERHYFVSLPESYSDDPFYQNKHYPVMILLDGESLFPLVSSMVHRMSHGSIEQIPEMIVVGVANTNRNRDFRPIYETKEGKLLEKRNEGAGLFMQFLEEELIPKVSEKYRTSESKILVGHSFGGLFAVNAWLNHQNFDAYLAIDPSIWWENEAVNEQLSAFLKENKNLPGSLYISQSNNPFDPGITGTRIGRAVQTLKKLLEEHADKDIFVRYDFFENEDHFSVPLISVYEGLRKLYEGYKYPLGELIKKTDQEIQAHYQQLAERLGKGLIPPGKLLDQVGLYLLHSANKPDAAIAILELNTQYYPQTYITWYHLGQAWAREGKPEQAKGAFQKALDIDPGNEVVLAAMEELHGG